MTLLGPMSRSSPDLNKQYIVKIECKIYLLRRFKIVFRFSMTFTFETEIKVPIFFQNTRNVLFYGRKTNLRRLVSLQKRVIRIISKSTFDSHSDPIFKELELLKLFVIRQLELGKLMFSFNHSLLPPKFNDYFSLNKQVHSYATRYANDFHLPFCRTNLRKFSVSFQGPTYYNSLENDIKQSYSLNSFKTKLKKKKFMSIISFKNLIVITYLSSHA